MDKKILLSAVCLAFSAHAMAESYQFEANANYANIKYDFDGADDTHLASISGVYYFSPVKTDNHPLKEAAFLEKNGSLSLAYLHSTFSYNYSYEDDYWSVDSRSESKDSVALLGVDTYLLDGFLYIGGFGSRDESKSSDSTTFTYKTHPNLDSTEASKNKHTENSWRVNLGVAPVNGLLIWSEFQKDIDVSDSWNLNAKYVMEFSGSALNLEAGYGNNALPNFLTPAFYPNNMKLNFSATEGEKSKSGYILGDYYFDNTISLGTGVSHNDFYDEDTYMVRAKKFFTNTFSLQAEYVKDEDQDAYSIGASIRF